MRSKVHIVLVIAVAIFITPSLYAANEVPRDMWLDGMSKLLPEAFCQPEQFFRQCFEVSEETCQQTATSTTRDCIEKLKGEMPEMFDTENGQYWGTQVGACAGSSYSMALLKNFKDTKKCNDPEAWK
ncbi:MAG: hypothetical protein JSV21_04225 [Nitrospirota bacterium]|nr:MAG: hypothetical protein JSV21_04225 [Nitrospirota bacterium]